MKSSTLNLFGSEWFGISISTLALAQVYILIFGITDIYAFHEVAEAVMILGWSIFALIFILWGARAIKAGEKIISHWDNLTRLSFLALIPIVGFVGNYQLIYFFHISAIAAELSLANFYFEYFLALMLGVLLGYRLYTKEINPREMNYAIVIPPLAIGTSVFLAPELMSYYGGVESQYLFFFVVMGLGIFFFLYIFIGSLALSGHVATKMHDVLPTTMLPVGIASLIVINLFMLSGSGIVDHLGIGQTTVNLLSVMLWGFEVWNFLVVTIIIFTRPSKGSLSVWAYGFPLGLFATSTIKIMDITGFGGLIWAFTVIAVALNAFWIYGWINTASFLREKFKGTKARDRAKRS
ncbi:MAG: C4-dicarboxylate ABC transporter [Candidatus Thermoplasmatota archaeon]|nr:C4-dicarboxylate ABC transporter [Candidatus Thermoplasmatota archaeon]MCL5678844.1 C4-dicarboxylate ABC transporter [Candidatus Thermoplasmatota archaeon]